MTSPITVDLSTRLDEIDSLRLQAQMLATRLQHLRKCSELTTRAETIERGVLVALFYDLRKLIDRLEEPA